MNLQHFEKIDSYLPIDLLSPSGFFLASVVVALFIIARYFGFVGLFYFLFWKKNVKALRSLHDQNLKPSQIRKEIQWSMLSSLIFAISGYVMGLCWQLGLTRIYLPLDAFGLWYLPVSFLLLALVHEVYFYSTHILLHQPVFYKRFHAVHHFSSKTSPWASFSFHPGEAFLQAAFLPLIVLFIPVHPLVVIAYLTFMTLTAISNHLGIELIGSPKILSWFISGSHHSLHHEKFSCNFGLYFRFLDIFFKTEHRAPAEKGTDK